MAGPPLFPIAPPRTAPSTFTAHPKPCRAGGEGRGTRIAPPSSPPCLAFFYCLHTAPSVFTASSRIQPLLRLFLRLTHPLKPGYNRQTPQQRPFCSAAVGDAGSVLHQGGGDPPQQKKKGRNTTPPPVRESAAPLPYLFHQVGPPPWSERQTRPTPSGLQR